jgi:hypothetical protein
MIILDGDTVKLRATFHDWDDVPSDPDLVSLIFYDERFNQINAISLGADDRLDVGSYFYDYTPTQTGNFYIEWYSETGGLPSLKRERVEVRKI